MKSRQDKHRKALRRGEYEKTGGGYEYRWREKLGVGEDGRMQYKQRSITARTLDELRAAETKIIIAKSDGLHPRPPQNLNTYVDKWFRIKRGLKDNTKQNYRYMYDKFVRGTRLGSTPLYKLKKSDIIAFFTDLVEKKHMSVSTCQILLNVISPSLSLAEDEDVIRRNPSRGALTELRKEARIKQADDRARNGLRIESMTLAEQRRFLDFIKGTTWYPVFLTELMLGLRVGELCGLTWSCIDEQAGVIHIKQTLVYYQKADKRCGLDVHSPKTKAGTRDLPLNDTVKEALAIQRRLTAGAKRVPVDGINDFIFLTREGRPHKQDTLNRALRRIVENANAEVGDNDSTPMLPMLHMHFLRKTCATNLCRAGYDIERIARHLGHSDLSVTHNIYIQSMHDIAADADTAMVKVLQDAGILDFAANNDSEQNDTQAKHDDIASSGEVAKQ